MIAAFRVLAPGDVDRIDAAARRLLETTGVGVDAPDFLDRFDDAGADVDRAARRVRLPADWLGRRLAEAPPQFTLHARDGAQDVPLGSGAVHFGNGGRVFRILDLQGEGWRPTQLRDVAATAAIVDRMENLRFYIVACHAHDVDPASAARNAFFHALDRTAKHVMGGCETRAAAEQAFEVAERITGGAEVLRAQPILSVITNVRSPLTFDEATLEVIRFCAERGVPLTCAPAPIAGATAPATLAGTLTQLHAEALAGVAFTQVFASGAKTLYGAVATVMDLRRMDFTMGSVEGALMNAAAVQMARRVGLPIYASSGLTESKQPDIQAGFEKTASNLMVAFAGADFIHLAAGMLDSGNSISYEQYVIDDEIIGMTHRILQGVRVDEDTLAEEVVARVGPGGQFMLEDHTVDHMMDEFAYPKLAVRENFDVWEAAGRPDMLRRASDVVTEILARKHSRLDAGVRANLLRAFPDLRDPP